jgi:hypothetical protein
VGSTTFSWAGLLGIRLRELHQGSTGSSRRRREAEITAVAAAADVELLALGKQFDQLELPGDEKGRGRRIERELNCSKLKKELAEKLDQEFRPRINNKLSWRCKKRMF